MLQEFKAFVNKGNVLAVAVGLIMALYFAKIVDAFLNGVINPIIAAIFGKPDFTSIGFDIGDSRISIGLVIDAAISFVLVGLRAVHDRPGVEQGLEAGGGRRRAVRGRTAHRDPRLAPGPLRRFAEQAVKGGP